MKAFGTAVILAGGASSRMGFDKQLLQIRNQRLTAGLFARLKSCFDDVLIVTNRSELYQDISGHIIQDIIPGKGPLSGIHAALSAAKSEYVYAMACDMPRFDPAYAKFMMKALQEGKRAVDACVTKKGGWIEPFHAFYGKSALPMLEADLLKDKSSVFYLMKKLNVCYIDEQEARRFTPDWSLFCNLNTREEYLAYLNSQGG